MELKPIRDILRHKTGFSCERVSASTMDEAIQAEMQEKGIISPAEYLGIIRNDATAFNDLVNLITINETYFFREPKHIQVFIDTLIPELIEEKTRPVKVLSAGCSTGAEPYSIAIALIEKYGTAIKERIQIMGADMDSSAVQKAKAGIYTGYAFRNSDKTIRDKYFYKTDHNNYAINKEIKEMVELYTQNLLDSDYPDILKDSDIIFYRNVSIYFDHDTQIRVFKKLSDILNENGYLVLGSAETFSLDVGIMALTEINGVFLYCKDKALINKEGMFKDAKHKKTPAKSSAITEPSLRKKAVHSPDATNTCLDKKKAAKESDHDEGRDMAFAALYDRASNLAGKKEYNEALKTLDEIKDHSIKVSMLKAVILAQKGQGGKAKDICAQAIELDPLCSRAYLLLGIIARQQRDDQGALNRFRQAVYADPECWPAHFYMAQIYYASGKNDRSSLEYKKVMDLAQNGLVAEPYAVLLTATFSEDQIVRVCRHKLDQLRVQE